MIDKKTLYPKWQCQSHLYIKAVRHVLYSLAVNVKVTAGEYKTWRTALIYKLIWVLQGLSKASSLLLIKALLQKGWLFLKYHLYQRTSLSRIYWYILRKLNKIYSNLLIEYHRAVVPFCWAVRSVRSLSTSKIINTRYANIPKSTDRKSLLQLISTCEILTQKKVCISSFYHLWSTL